VHLTGAGCEQTEFSNLVSGLISIGIKSRLLKVDEWANDTVIDAAIMQVTGDLFHKIDIDGEGTVLIRRWQELGVPAINTPSFVVKLQSTIETHAMRRRDEFDRLEHRRVMLGSSGNRRSSVSAGTTGTEKRRSRKKGGKKARRSSLQGLALLDRLTATAVAVDRARDGMVRKILIQRVASWTRCVCGLG